jgi:membrane-associated protease RseP (regulator of RpoE activity)
MLTSARLRGLALLALALAFSATAVEAQRSPGWIGIGFEVWSDDRGESNVTVTEVRDGSPAAAAGVRVGDRLITINDARTASEFENLAQRLALRVGDRVNITLIREGRPVEISLRAAERPADFTAVTVKPAVPADSMVESMFRAMDSLRVQILAARGVRAVAGRQRSDQPASTFVAGVPAGPQPVSAPFEFFVFRGEQHDSLRLAMEALNRRIGDLRQQAAQLEDRRRERGTSRADAQALDRQLAELQEAIEEITLESSELRAAMAEAARVSAGFQHRAGDVPPVPDVGVVPEPEPFSPLTPYLLGSNRVGGAELVDLRPGLAEYFGVEAGVLVVDVAPGTPMATAGIQPGDVIVNLDRVPVRTVDALRMGISRAADTLPVTLIRRGSSLEVLLRRR